MVGKNMIENNANPLAKHFRQPTIYIKLPSGGAWNAEETLKNTENGELPVYPMTALDEIAYRTADALFNGSAVADVIKSCMPNILDPWQISSADLDTILVAIRIASYGHEMDFTSKCPKCEESNDFSIDLREIMDKIKMPDFSEPVIIGDITVYFKPLTYKDQNDNNTAQFQDQKMLEALPTSDMPEEEKIAALQQAFNNISLLTLNAIADSISMMKTGDDVVVDKDHIKEYLQNCNNKSFDKIRKKIEKVKLEGEMSPLQIVCNDCKHEYTTPFTLNVANFFA
jgi:hypothetical protein|tara:strand:+ start:183 stop:1034 length:852 start_codon:yes stop_codon:yes gene_type:complete